MYNQKPLYPVPWWSVSCPPVPPVRCDMPSPGEEFVVRYVGTDCEGNALFCLKRKRNCLDAPPPCPYPMPRYR